MPLGKRRWPYAVFALIAALLAASAISRQIASAGGMDFLAYFKAASRWLSGTTPYVVEEDFAWKYSPSTLLLVWPLALVPPYVGRWVFTLGHLALALGLPWVARSILIRDERISPSLSTWAIACLVSLAGSLRFVDGEFQVSQSGLWILGLILGGLWLLVNGRTRIGLVVLAFGAWIKAHPILIFATFLGTKRTRDWAWLILVPLAVGLLPWPPLLLDWAHQMRVNTGFEMTALALNFQGFYSLARVNLGFGQSGPAPLLLTLPFFVFALWRLPKLDLARLQRSPVALCLTVFAWMLFGFMSSPLPWQYTFSILWIFFAVSWLCGDALERRMLLAVCAWLALTPSGIVGRPLAAILESRQSVFFAILVYWFVLVRQARRWDSAEAPSLGEM